MHPETRISGTERVVFRTLVDERSVLLHLDTAAYHGLNKVGTLIWTLVEHGTTFERLLAALRAELEDAPEGLPEDVSQFLHDLAERDLVVVAPADA